MILRSATNVLDRRVGQPETKKGVPKDAFFVGSTRMALEPYFLPWVLLGRKWSG